MNIKYLFLMLLSIFSIESAFAQTSGVWEISDTSMCNYGQYPRYPEIAAFDSENIYLLGGTAYPRPHYIKKSTDEGKSWSRILNTGSNIDLNSISNPSKDYVAVAGDTVLYLEMDQYFNAYYKYWGYLSYSTNGGKDWQNNILDSNTRVLNLAMYDSKTGIALQKRMPNRYNSDVKVADTLLVTNDGWASYKKVVLPKASTQFNQTFCFSATDFKVNMYDQNQQKYLLFSTTNAGKDWVEIEIPSIINKIFFLNKDLAWATTSESKLIFKDLSYHVPGIIKSTDGGMSWQKLSIPQDTSIKDDKYVSDISFFDENNGVAVGTANIIMRTEDGGANWYSDDSPYLKNLPMKNGNYSFAKFISKNLAIIGGGGGSEAVVLKYTGKKTLSAPSFIMKNISNSLPDDINFNWTKVEGATKYHLQIIFDTTGVYNPDFYNTQLIVDIELTENTYKITNGKYKYCYEPRVKALNDSQESVWGSTNRRTCAFPDASYISGPEIIYPALYETVAPEKLIIKWTNCGAGVTYDLQVNSEQFFYGNIDYDIKNISDTSYAFDDVLKSNTTYYTRLRVHPGTKKSYYSNSAFATSQATSVIDLSEDLQNIYPNPATDNIEILVPKGVQVSVPLQMEIYSIEGIQMQSTSLQPSPFSERAIQVDVSGLVPGVYFVKIGDKVRKFVKM